MTVYAWSGIYQLRNRANDKVYIGQSCDVLRRYKEHLKLLRKSKHYNDFLQNAWNKYGVSAFVLEVICLVPPDKLNELEIQQIISKNSTDEDFGYNICPGGKNGCRAGMKNSPTHRAAISAAKKGKPGPLHTAESREAIRVALTGKKKSESHREAMSRAMLGGTPPNLGVPHSEIAKRRMSAAKATIEWEGEMLSLRALAKKVGMERVTISCRLRRGMTLLEAVTTPMQRVRIKKTIQSDSLLL